MFPCAMKGCPALAEKPGGECAVHRTYRKHDGSRTLKCGACGGTIAQGQFYEYDGTHSTHASTRICKAVKARTPRADAAVSP